MIESVQETIVTLVSNSSALTFVNDEIRTKSANCCGWLQHNEGSPIFKILEGGIYEINFNANLSSATTGTIAVGLYEDGILIPGTTTIVEVATAGDYYNVSFSKLRKICCRGDATLSVQAVPSVLTGVDPAATETEIPIYQNANFSIVKKA